VVAGDDRAGLTEATAVLVAVVAGLCGAVQPEINAELGSRLDANLLAALVNFAVALLVAVVVVARRPTTRRHLRVVGRWPVPRWTYLAGLGGAIVVLSGVAAVERLGVAVFSVAFFAGQMTSGLLVDSLGLAPGRPRPITRLRLAAVGLALTAVVLSQVGQPVGDIAPALVAFVVGAGGASALQAAANARITAALGEPAAATVVNVVVGTVALVLVSVVGAMTVIDAPSWPTEPWLYLGGVLGITIVLALAAASAAIGVLGTTIAMLAAQLVGAFVVDWIARDDAPTAGVLAGSALTVVAVLLVNRATRAPARWSAAVSLRPELEADER
jgi:transporter family-2 protein